MKIHKKSHHVTTKYDVVEKSLAHLISKIDLNPQNHDYCEFFYFNVKVIGYKIIDDGTIDLVYKSKQNDDTFTVTIRLARLDYSRMGGRGPINKNNYQIIGITVGDLIKHFYHNNKNETKFSDDENENDRMNELVKKSISTDTSCPNLTDLLGMYYHDNQRIYLRTMPTISRQSGTKQMRSCDKNDFASFCKKLLFFGDYELLLQKDTNTGTHYVNEENCNDMFNNLSSRMIIKYLLKYYLYGDCSFFGDGSDTYQFDIPSLVPDILKYFHDYFGDDRYIDMYHKVMKLNTGQKRDLEKYKENIFDSIHAVPKEYPVYAFRNVRLKQWHDRDLSLLYTYYNNYMKCVKDEKYKYKSSVSKKVIPMNNRFYAGHRYYNPSYGHCHEREQELYFSKRNMYYAIKDCLKDYENNYEIEQAINDEEILFDDLLIRDQYNS